MYALINRLPDDKLKKDKIIEILSKLGEEYLSNILKVQDNNKIILGKGGFGKVRLAISLLESICKPS